MHKSNMEAIFTYKDFKILKLSRSLAEKYTDEIISALDLIPQVDRHTSFAILSEKKGERVLHAKWAHSLLILDNNDNFVGVLLGYERESEGNEQYPSNCLYLSSIAVKKRFQGHGLGRFLVKTWINQCREIGYLILDGRIRFCVQTSKEDWNKHVQNFYESFGFKKIAEKSYGSRIDNVYSLDY